LGLPRRRHIEIGQGKGVLYIGKGDVALGGCRHSELSGRTKRGAYAKRFRGCLRYHGLRAHARAHQC
jgi:hypothetical protein